MHGPLIKANLSYYVTRAICAAVNQFDYLHKKQLIYMVGMYSDTKHYKFFWCYGKTHPNSHNYVFAGQSRLVRFLNYYVSPWLKVSNETSN